MTWPDWFKFTVFTFFMIVLSFFVWIISLLLLNLRSTYLDVVYAGTHPASAPSGGGGGGGVSIQQIGQTISDVAGILAL